MTSAVVACHSQNWARRSPAIRRSRVVQMVSVEQLLITTVETAGYSCVLYSRTGTSYCCQTSGVELPSVQDNVLCAGTQVTFFEPLTGLPKTCALGTGEHIIVTICKLCCLAGSCPVGFGCNLVGGSVTRCCGRDFACPLNSAGFVNPNTGAHVPCNIADPT